MWKTAANVLQRWSKNPPVRGIVPVNDIFHDLEMHGVPSASLRSIAFETGSIGDFLLYAYSGKDGGKLKKMLTTNPDVEIHVCGRDAVTDLAKRGMVYHLLGIDPQQPLPVEDRIHFHHVEDKTGSRESRNVIRTKDGAQYLWHAPDIRAWGCANITVGEPALAEIREAIADLIEKEVADGSHSNYAGLIDRPPVIPFIFRRGQHLHA